MFLATLAFVAVPALVYASGYLATSPARRALSGLGAGFLLAMTAVLVARDITVLLAGWELMTLFPATAILVARGTEAAVRRAVFIYLGMAHVGGAGTWAALLVLADHGAITDTTATRAVLSPGLTAFVAVAAIVGFGTKAGLMPLHGWLPRAHPVAPSHISALMSGVMIKIALYGLIRVLFEWLGPVPLWVGLAVLAMGLLSALAGVLYALFEEDLKRLLAFSSIENAGIVTLGLGAALVFRNRGSDAWAALALGAALLHTVNHAAFKALLFLGAGAFERTAGSLRLDALGGLLRRMPWTGGAFLLACLAIAGVPPLNGFVSEWLTLQALVHLAGDQPVGIVVAGAVAVAGLAATTALGVYTFVKVAGLVLLGAPRTPEAAAADEGPRTMRAAMVALAALCVALAAVPGVPLVALSDVSGLDAGLQLRAGVEVPGTRLGTLALLGGLAALTALLAAARGARRAAPEPAWACGQPAGRELGYSPAGFTSPLGLVLAAERGTVPHWFDTRIHAPTVRVALRGARAARRVQSGSVRAYAAYLLGALVAGLLLANWGAFG
jgi:formate hydrogenlyase subunit 3/multisubunit Na+/H+ antiporter MnhD subunit